MADNSNVVVFDESSLPLRDHITAKIVGVGLNDALVVLYDKFPEFRGLSPNLIVNLAFFEFLRSKGLSFTPAFKVSNQRKVRQFFMNKDR